MDLGSLFGPLLIFAVPSALGYSISKLEPFVFLSHRETGFQFEPLRLTRIGKMAGDHVDKSNQLAMIIVTTVATSLGGMSCRSCRFDDLRRSFLLN